MSPNRRPTIALVPARAVHVGPIATRMREADVLECRAMGHSPKQALRAGLFGSDFCLTATVDGRPEAMLGLVVTNALCGEGSPWMLGTEAIYRHPRAMLVLGRNIVARMIDSTPVLRQLVAVENGRAIRMLRRWGFVLEDRVVRHGSIPFVPFSLESH